MVGRCFCSRSSLPRRQLDQRLESFVFPRLKIIIETYRQPSQPIWKSNNALRLYYKPNHSHLHFLYFSKIPKSSSGPFPLVCMSFVVVFSAMALNVSGVLKRDLLRRHASGRDGCLCHLLVGFPRNMGLFVAESGGRCSNVGRVLGLR